MNWYYWEEKVKNTIVVVKVEPKKLTNADAEFTRDSTSGNGGKTYQKPESESDKLQARWEFLKQHLGKDYDIASLYELGALLAMQQSTPEAVEEQQTLVKALELIAGMWK